MEIDRNAQRMRKCPHFDFCDVVRCPLDVLICQRVRLSDDKARCRLSKGKRMKLGSDMETKGLNRYEVAALVRTYGLSKMVSNGQTTIFEHAQKYTAMLGKRQTLSVNKTNQQYISDTLEIAFKHILNQNFCVKNEVKFLRNSKGRVRDVDGEVKGRLEEMGF